MAEVVAEHPLPIGEAVVTDGAGLLLIVAKQPGANSLDARTCACVTAFPGPYPHCGIGVKLAPRPDARDTLTSGEGRGGDGEPDTA